MSYQEGTDVETQTITLEIPHTEFTRENRAKLISLFENSGVPHEDAVSVVDETITQLEDMFKSADQFREVTKKVGDKEEVGFSDVFASRYFLEEEKKKYMDEKMIKVIQEAIDTHDWVDVYIKYDDSSIKLEHFPTYDMDIDFTFWNQITFETTNTQMRGFKFLDLYIDYTDITPELIEDGPDSDLVVKIKKNDKFWLTIDFKSEYLAPKEEN